MSDIQHSPYTERLILETLRLYAGIPFIPHASYKNTTVRGFHLPRNTTVSNNCISINSNPKLFPNPTVFDPS